MSLKVPHWAQIALVVATVVVAQLTVESKNGGVNLPAWGISLLAIASGVLGLLSKSVMTGTISTSQASTRGMAKLRVILVLACIGVLGLLIIGPTAQRERTRQHFEDVLLTGQGCSWWAGNSKQVVTATGEVAACVIGALLSGATDATMVVNKCTGSTLADVVAIAASLIDYYTAPKPGIGATLPPEILASLRTVRDDAKAKLAAAH